MTQAPLDNNRLLALLGKPTPELQAAVEAKAEATFQLLEAKLGKPLNRAVISYNLKGRTAGLAWSFQKLIQLNLGLLNDPRYQDDMLNDTVPHEVCHIVQYQIAPRSKSHGYEWQRLMLMIGLQPTRCHSYETTPARKHSRPHSYRCDCDQVRMVTNLMHTKIQPGKIYTCNNCKGRLR